MWATQTREPQKKKLTPEPNVPNESADQPQENATCSRCSGPIPPHVQSCPTCGLAIGEPARRRYRKRESRSTRRQQVASDAEIAHSGDSIGALDEAIKKTTAVGWQLTSRSESGARFSTPDGRERLAITLQSDGTIRQQRQRAASLQSSQRAITPAKVCAAFIGILALFRIIGSFSGMLRTTNDSSPATSATTRPSTSATQAWDLVGAQVQVDFNRFQQAQQAGNQTEMDNAQRSALGHCHDADNLGVPPAGDQHAQNLATVCAGLGAPLTSQ